MFFQRFTVKDPTLLQKDIEETQRELQAVQAMGDTSKSIELASDLGGMLTTARREAEAQSLLLEYLALARMHGNNVTTGWLLLNLATANQYLVRKAEVNSQFSEALDFAKVHNDKQLEHFVLHHWGRSLVEDGELARAKMCFDQALALRVLLNVSWQESTQRALEALDVLIRNSKND